MSLSLVSGGVTVEPWPHRQSTERHADYPPRKENTLRGMGGGTGGVHRGVAQARHCKSPIPPPPIQRTKHSCNGGGGGGGFIGGAFKQELNIAYPPP